jgi:hypothetical protein
VLFAIANKNTRFGTILKLMGVVRSKERPTFATKGFEKFMIRGEIEEELKRGFVVSDLGW